MIPLIVIRSQPGADRTVAAAGALGLDAWACPSFEVSACAWQAPAPERIEALLIGSANAIRHAGPALARFKDKPVHAVGEATAAACRAAGLKVAATGKGDLQALLERVEPPARLLRLAGEERVALRPPAGVSLTERVVYASRPLAAEAGLVHLLKSPCTVALHSAAAARHFAGECDRLGLARSHIRLVTIGPRVTEAAGSGWASVGEAAEPSDEALLACALELCQNPSEGR
jgi:uroporphyrinogen-III synthase